MSDQGEQFQHSWEFGRTENDPDSIRVDHHSRPSSSSDPKQIKPKPATDLFSAEEIAQLTLHTLASHPTEEKENNSSFGEPNRQPDQPSKTQERKTRTRRTKKTSYQKASDAALLELRRHMVSLVQEIDTTREELIAWMHNKLKFPSKNKNVVNSCNPSRADNINSFTPTRTNNSNPFIPRRTNKINPFIPGGTRVGQLQNMKRSRRSPIYIFNRGRETSGPTAENYEGACSEWGSRSNNGVSILPMEGELPVTYAVAAENNKRQKEKEPISSELNQNHVAVEADQGTNNNNNNAGALDANNYLTLPTIMPPNQAINNERISSEDGNEVVFGNSNASLSSRANLMNSHRNNTITAQPVVRNYASANGGGNGNGNGVGNGNANAFSFPIIPQGLNHGVGVQNVQSQFGVQSLQYLTRSTMIVSSGRVSTGNQQAFMGSFSTVNTQMSYSQQGRVVMAALQGQQTQNVTSGASSQALP